jgi:hypothetical protein
MDFANLVPAPTRFMRSQTLRSQSRSRRQTSPVGPLAGGERKKKGIDIRMKFRH